MLLRPPWHKSQLALSNAAFPGCLCLASFCELGGWAGGNEATRQPLPFAREAKKVGERKMLSAQTLLFSQLQQPLLGWG